MNCSQIDLRIFQRTQDIFYHVLLYSTESLRIFRPVVHTILVFGGDERDRTADLPRAKRTLYQLSYIPATHNLLHIMYKVARNSKIFMVGLSRLERLTSPLSAECSNQLSYRPKN